MQDFIRTSTYQKAILDNPADFTGRVFGSGSDIHGNGSDDPDPLKKETYPKHW